MASSLLFGCATYHPRPGHHIARVSHNEFVRDGQTFPIGPFGGGSEALVNGHAPALAHVRREQRLLRVGWVLYAAGLAAVVGGAIAAGTAAPEGAKEAALFGAAGLGLAITTTGFVFIGKGQTALIDAVNIYNDDVAAQSPGAPR